MAYRSAAARRHYRRSHSLVQARPGCANYAPPRAAKAKRKTTTWFALPSASPFGLRPLEINGFDAIGEVFSAADYQIDGLLDDRDCRAGESVWRTNACSKFR
jgi:hypothetical protein